MPPTLVFTCAAGARKKVTVLMRGSDGAGVRIGAGTEAGPEAGMEAGIGSLRIGVDGGDCFAGQLISIGAFLG